MGWYGPSDSPRRPSTPLDIPLSNINDRQQIYRSFLKIKNCNIVCLKFRIFTSLTQCCLNICKYYTSSISNACHKSLVYVLFKYQSSRGLFCKIDFHDHQESRGIQNNSQYGPHNILILLWWNHFLTFSKRIFEEEFLARFCGRFCTHYISYEEALRQSYNYISYKEALRQNYITHKDTSRQAGWLAIAFYINNDAPSL